MSGCGCEVEVKDNGQRAVLIALLAINAAMFGVEIVLGIASESTALIADSLDMLADAAVYAIGLHAVARSPLVKIKAARLSGIMQIVLGTTVLVDVTRRAVFGSEPESLFMIGVGLVALVANVVCLVLIAKYRNGEVHMRASWIFSKNDVITNVGVVVAGGLVHAFGSRFPDLVIGLVISVIVVRGGLQIVRDANREVLAVQAG